MIDDAIALFRVKKEIVIEIVHMINSPTKKYIIDRRAMLGDAVLNFLVTEKLLQGSSFELLTDASNLACTEKSNFDECNVGFITERKKRYISNKSMAQVKLKFVSSHIYFFSNNYLAL